MKRLLLSAFCIAFVLLCFLDINSFLGSGRAAVQVFGSNVLPVLFPFFFVSSVLVRLRAAPVTILSLLSGYPTGARVLAELHNNNQISEQAALHKSTYTSTPSPIFVIATVGACFYGSMRVGIIIFVAILIGALLNGLVYKHTRRFAKRCQLEQGKESLCTTKNIHTSASNKNLDISQIISDSLYSSIQAILSIGGLIIVFFILSSQLQSVFNLPPLLNALTSGALEMTNGALWAGRMNSSPLLACAIVTFGGVCVALQGLIFARSFGMNFPFYLLYKTTHTILAVAVCWILLLVV
jgi:ABC-type multidrug transport system fused ATPase/permease subunit